MLVSGCAQIKACSALALYDPTDGRTGQGHIPYYRTAEIAAKCRIGRGGKEEKEKRARKKLRNKSAGQWLAAVIPRATVIFYKSTVDAMSDYAGSNAGYYTPDDPPKQTMLARFTSYVGPGGGWDKQQARHK